MEGEDKDMASSLADNMTRSARWLASLQDEVSGGWGEYKGAATNSLNTAEAVLALLESGQYKAGDVAIRKGEDYLKATQIDDRKALKPGDLGAWGRRVVDAAGQERMLPDTIRTSLALLALNCAGEGTDAAAMTAGLAWLVKTRNEDGCWGHADGHDSRSSPTCFALRALLRLHGAGGSDLRQWLQEPIRTGLDHLRTVWRNDSGSFGDEPDLVVPHTLYAVTVLRLAQQQGFGAGAGDLETAVGWIGRQGEAATRWANELIALSDDESDSYTFTHVTPAIYLDAFGDDLSKQDAIAKESLIVIHDNMDPVSCGFAAKRPVSWATSKNIYGLAAVVKVFEAFPERNIPSGHFEGRQYLFIFLVAISLLTTIVALAGKLSSEFVGVVVLVILGGLLIYGYISEESFVKLFFSRKRLQQKVSGG
jgi:hypothetical protein